MKFIYKEIFMFYDIEEFLGFYKISKNGDVLSISRNGKIGKDTIIKPTIGTNGYLKVLLRCNGQRYTRNIHRLIAINFIGNVGNLPCVNHIDGDKLNNSISNLEWVSYSRNAKHAYDNSLTKPATGESRSNLSNEDVMNIVDCKLKGLTLKSISEKFGISPSTVSDIVLGRTWSHLTGIEFNPNSFRGKKSKTGEKGVVESNNGKFDVFVFLNGKNKYLIRLNDIESAIEAKKIAMELIYSGKEIKQVVEALRSVFK